MDTKPTTFKELWPVWHTNAKTPQQGKSCRILSGDKDLMQLVTETTQILKPDHADVWKVTGPQGVQAEWGVPPEQLLDLLSLYGDSADNIPGVQGVGVKTAGKLLEQYKNLDGIYEHIDEIKGAMQKKLIDGKGRVLLRQSGTEPVVRVMVEAETTELCEKYAAMIADVIKERGHCVD